MPAIAIEGVERLEPAEKARAFALVRAASLCPGRALRVAIVDAPPFAAREMPREATPAQVSWEGGRVLLTHRAFQADIDVAAASARVFRAEPGPLAFEITLRVQLCCALPFDGGLPLHAAGVALGEEAVAFFGVSGAGKSTLASLAPGPVLSDELVAMVGDPPSLAATGFWGAGPEADVARGRYPLRALVALAKGPRFALTRLAPARAYRSLLEVLTLPAMPMLWRVATGVLARRVAEVPVYRMEWTPTAAPWSELASALDRDAHR